MIVAAFPEAAGVVMVCEETGEERDNELSRTYAFAPELISEVRKKLIEFGDIESLTFYGPRSYITPFVEQARKNFDVEIHLEGAGE